MNKAKVFMIMPFNDESFEVYDMLMAEFKDDFNFSNAGQEGNQQNILSDIIQPLYNADIIIADLTGLNSNVLYELGVAHALNKKTINITKDDIDKLPFDLKQYRTSKFSTGYISFRELIKNLRVYLLGAVNGSVVFSNPVQDFLKSHVLQTNSLSISDKTDIITDNTEDGFIDFLTSINDSAAELTKATTDISGDLSSMANRIDERTKEIEQVKKTGGNGTASFIQKEAKKVADYIRDYSGKLQNYNIKYLEMWDTIERGSLGLLENKFVDAGENKKQLELYLKSLMSFKDAVSTMITQTIKMKKANDGNLGLERNLNQAIRLLDYSIDTQLTQMNQTCASIDQIMMRSKSVVDFEND